MVGAMLVPIMHEQCPIVEAVKPAGINQRR
jgi:hypothetical protein